MAREYFASTKDSIDRQLIEFQNFELQIISQDRIDDLSPTLKSMEGCQIVLEILLELSEYIKINGKSERLNKSSKRLLKLLDIIGDLNNMSGSLNTLKLQNKSMYSQWLDMKKQNSDLKKQIETYHATTKEL